MFIETDKVFSLLASPSTSAAISRRVLLEIGLQLFYRLYQLSTKLTVDSKPSSLYQRIIFAAMIRKN